MYAVDNLEQFLQLKASGQGCLVVEDDSTKVMRVHRIECPLVTVERFAVEIAGDKTENRECYYCEDYLEATVHFGDPITVCKECFRE